ncbi:MAG: DUF1344 domain-containing protein [Hyphomicrobiaceae bacterium]|nr:DUF1344 domain-containing protein [Hyphomicrobiaceae bacterium]MCC0024579.1 DUF1344 domain-containing protein [Hyphomicrobiaceae bacterium]
MRTLFITAAAAALLSTSAMAFPLHSTQGTVEYFDLSTGALRLSDGINYTLPDNFQDPGLVDGAMVKLIWDAQGQQHMVQSLAIERL